MLTQVIGPFFRVPLLRPDQRQQPAPLHALRSGLQEHQQHLGGFILEARPYGDLPVLVVQSEPA